MRATLGDRLRVVLAVLLTLAALHYIADRLLVLLPLAAIWTVLYYPLSRGELLVFALAGVTFLFQNYMALSAGLFEFRFKDILLQPYYEPLLWGFYFLSMKRFVRGRSPETARVGWKSLAGVLVTSFVFGVFSYDSHVLLAATLVSTLLLFVFFHTGGDVSYALFALALGLVIELFGVSTGLWWYPAPDFLGIPFWFATMWISVGLLGRRFVVPAAEWLAGRFTPQRA